MNPSVRSADPRAIDRRSDRASERSTGLGMSKTTINFWLDALLLAIFMTLIWTSVVVRFAFPPAVRAEGWMLWGWGYEQWQAFQSGVVCAMAGAVLLHVMLHWGWVSSVAAGGIGRLRGRKKQKPDEGMQTIYGVGTLIVIVNLVGLAIAAAVLTIQPPPNQ
jgi:hypothetical protein